LQQEEELHEGVTPQIWPDVPQPHPNQTILDQAGVSSPPGGQLHHVWRNVRHLVPIEPTILPKSGTRSIFRAHSRCGVEERNAHYRQLDVEPNPRLRRIHSLELGLSTMKGKIQEFDIAEV
jgi:hypothetical protein